MKTTISSLELHYMVKELQDLVGARLDKVYHRKDELMLQLYSVKTKKAFLFFKLPSIMFLGDYKPDTDDSAGGFCMFLRKKINMFRIEKIEQVGFERIVKIRFAKNEDAFDLAVELFSPGNILLLDTENKILSMQNSLYTKDRVIRGGIEYNPLIREYDPKKMEESDLVEFFAKTDKESIVKALAIDLGFGGVFAEEICTSAEVDKDTKKPKGSEVKKIHDAIKDLFDRKIEPINVGNEILPFPLRITENYDKLDESFYSAVADNLKDDLVGKKHQENLDKQGKDLKKAQSILKKQKNKIIELEKAIEENQRIGEIIYEKYSDIQELIRTINDAKKNHDYDEIKKRLIEKGYIKDLDKKEQSIIIDL